MQIRFSKMHGLGNDFMVIDGITQVVKLEPEQIREFADRHTGVGFDQLLVVETPTDPKADFRYRIYNADGNEVAQCGNGARCFARFVIANSLSTKHELTLQTSNGHVRTRLLDGDAVEVNMGIPRTEPADVPFDAPSFQPSYDVEVDGRHFTLSTVSLGNPHAVLFVDNVFEAPVAELGALIATSNPFPEGTNVGFCQVVDSGFARLRVYERGVGETRACGSGACAAAVAGQLTGRLGTRSKISLPGGKVRISWPGPGSELMMTGPTALVYEGTIEL